MIAVYQHQQHHVGNSIFTN
jgi:lipoate-protein ligase B